MELISVAQFLRMVELGFFEDEDNRVELLEGEIFVLPRQSPPHAATLQRTSEALRSRVPESWRVRVRSATTTVDSVPEADLSVIRGPVGRYDDRHPTPADTALVIEVADSASLSNDRGIKFRVYSRAGIGTYWIVNVVDRVVEVHTQPTGPSPAPAYGRRQSVTPDDVLQLSIDGIEMRVPASELFSG